jgi:integrase
LLGTKFRDISIKIKCDECNEEYKKPIRRLDKKNFHICKKCNRKGERNPMYGKAQSEKNKKALKEFFEKNGNPFTWDYVKEKLKEKKTESTEKTAQKNRGKKRSKEVNQRKSQQFITAYREGKWKIGNGYSNIKVKKYKNIPYQGTYELKFLEYIDVMGKIDIIERGPMVPYMFNNNEHSYFVDFRIKGTDILFEIKSSYYWEKSKEVNIIKKETCEKLYNYNIIMDNNFLEVKKIIEQYE